MKKLLFTFCAVCCIAATHAQNLVTNGSFETKDPALGCPAVDGFTLGKPANWDGYISKAGNNLDPDYFNTCATNDGVHNYPGNNIGGCEYPLQGSAYVGFLAFATNVGSAAQSSEYLYSTVSLTSGQQYYVEFYVSAAEGCPTNNLFCGFPSTFFSKRIGMFITRSSDAKNVVEFNQVNGLNQLTPQIPNNFPAANYYTTTTGWQKISGTFTATFTGSHNIYIGNFDPGMNNVDTNGTAHPDLLGPKSTFTSDQSTASYYFLDGVTILPVNTTAPDYTVKVIGADLVCTASNYNLQNQPFGTTLSWSSSDPANLSIDGSGVATRLNNFNGQVTITGTFSGPCGNTQVTKPLAVGSPTPSYLNANHDATACPEYYFDTEQVSGATSYLWQWNKDPNGIVRTKTTFTNTSGGKITLVDGNGTYRVGVKVTNTCGTSGFRVITFPVNCSGGPKKVIVSASPNPATNILNINASLTSSLLSYTISNTDNNQSEIEQNFNFEAKLFSPFQQLVRAGTSQNGTVAFNVADLQNGIYYLHIITGTEIISKHIMISK